MQSSILWLSSFYIFSNLWGISTHLLKSLLILKERSNVFLNITLIELPHTCPETQKHLQYLPTFCEHLQTSVNCINIGSRF